MTSIRELVADVVVGITAGALNGRLAWTNQNASE
jgi:hypothetical protein